MHNNMINLLDGIMIIIIFCHYFFHVGEQSTSSTQYYYGDYRYHFRHPWPERCITESIADMTHVEEEHRVTIRRKIASDTGFTGVSILHRLHDLYQFNTLHLVFDTMHTLLLVNIKRHLEHYMAKGYITPSVEERLNAMPWTAGL